MGFYSSGFLVTGCRWGASSCQERARYIHLNPLRAGLVRDLPALDRYRWAGHSAVLGRYKRPWQAVDEILGHFGTKAGPARLQ